MVVVIYIDNATLFITHFFPLFLPTLHSSTLYIQLSVRIFQLEQIFLFRAHFMCKSNKICVRIQINASTTFAQP